MYFEGGFEWVARRRAASIYTTCSTDGGLYGNVQSIPTLGAISDRVFFQYVDADILLVGRGTPMERAM